MNKRPTDRIIRRKLLTWFAKNRRDLPWRLPAGLRLRPLGRELGAERGSDSRSRQAGLDPYHILVSEVMLQQTQVDRVVPKYLAWIRTFPTVQSLARAPLTQVLKLWSGLGYNSRAKRLRDLAQIVVRHHHGIIPTAVDQLEGLPGIGPYTARAVASFAINTNTAVIDTNVRRVVSRVFFGLRTPTVLELDKTVTTLLPVGKSATWNATLMDFGSAVCTSRSPKCSTCPLQSACRAYPAVLEGIPIRRSSTPVRFQDSDRYWRGAIIRSLVRSSPQTVTGLMRGFPSLPKVERLRIVRLLRSLTSEGLIEQRGQQLRFSQ